MISKKKLISGILLASIVCSIGLVLALKSPLIQTNSEIQDSRPDSGNSDSPQIPENNTFAFSYMQLGNKTVIRIFEVPKNLKLEAIEFNHKPIDLSQVQVKTSQTSNGNYDYEISSTKIPYPDRQIGDSIIIQFSEGQKVTIGD